MSHSRIVDQFGSPYPSGGNGQFSRLLSKYDAAQTTTDNMLHWANADAMSADAAASTEVRKKIRERARYERANNSYCMSMVETIAGDVIGSGPRIQVRTGHKDSDRAIERAFFRWGRAVRLGHKMRIMRKAKAVDGEAFAIFRRNKRTGVPVQLDLNIVECDRVTNPTITSFTETTDGIHYDRWGNPSEYCVLAHHPGETAWGGGFGNEYSWVPANLVLHAYRVDRSEQHRGVSEIAPALRLFSQLRRYTLAVLAAAETAADFAAVISSPANPDPVGFGPHGTESTSIEPNAMDVFELAQRMVTVLPEGYQLGQIKAEQPVTTYGEFKREILAEAFAAMVMPFNVGAHDSSDFNFASGKLDRLGYGRLAQLEQCDWEDVVVFPVFRTWAAWAISIPGYLPVDGLPPIETWDLDCYWDGLDDIDPEKAANASATELGTFQTTHQRLWAEKGLDWEYQQETASESLGLTVDEFRKRLADKLLGPDVSAIPQPQGNGNAQTQDRQATRT